jgi:ribonuclease HI
MIESINNKQQQQQQQQQTYQQRHFKIWQQNVNGFYSKKDMIEYYCKQQQPNVCLFQELFRSTKSSDIFNYFDHEYKLMLSETGRTGILFKNDHNQLTRITFNNKLNTINNKWNQCGFESIWAELKCPGKQSIIFCSFYRDGERKEIKTNNNNNNNDKYFDQQRFEQEYKYAKEISPYIIIGGDFNCKHWMWGELYEDIVGESISDFITNNNLQVINNIDHGPTCRSTTDQTGSYVDITITTTNTLLYLTNWRCNDAYFDIESDHQSITYNLLLDDIQSQQHNKLKTRNVWNFNKSKWDKYEENMETDMEKWIEKYGKDWNDLDNNNAPKFEQALKIWYQIINYNATTSIPKKKVTNKSKKWWNQDLTNAKREMIQWNKLRKYDKTDEELYDNYQQSRKKFKQLVKQQKKRSNERMFNTINNPTKRKEMFNIFRNLTTSKIISIPSIESNNKQLAITSLEKAELLANHFAQPPQPPQDENKQHQSDIEQYLNEKVNPYKNYEIINEESVEAHDEEEKEEILQDYSTPCDNNNNDIISKELEYLNNIITEDEVIEARKHVGYNKASGPDNIHNQLLKHGGDYFNQSLTILFNWSYTIGYMPKQWKLCNIAPIPKPGKDHTKATNYRPIALLSCVGKLMERIFSQRLLKYLKETELLNSSQAGFQSYHNTYELLLKLTENIYQTFKNNSILEAVFLDISSAYDSVWRDGLRYKLRNNFKLKGKFYWWIDSFLSNRKGRTVVNGIKSEWKLFNTGVPQGSSLSPLLFIMYINDIANEINIDSQIGMFADDVALWTYCIDNNIINMEQEHNKLQESLNNIIQWCNKWKMILSTTKTQYMIFKSSRKRNYPQNLTITLNNKIIKPLNKVVYLGLHLDPQLSFKPHIIDYLLPKVSKRLGYLTMLTKFNGNKCFPHILSYQILYKMILRPAMDYASAFWNGASITYKEILNKIQRKALNRGIKLMNNTSYDTTNIINYIEPLEYRRQQEEIKLLKRAKVYYVQFPKHSLATTYKFWSNNQSDDEYPVFNYKLSVLTRATINCNTNNIDIPSINELEQQPQLKQMPRIIKLPSPTNSPYLPWIDKHYDDILLSFKSNEIRTIIFTDGSCINNPGYGGAGIAIYYEGLHPNKYIQQPIELEYPINGLTTNIAAEIVAIDKTIDWINKNTINNNERIIIFSDCKPVIDAITNRTKAKHYQSSIFKIQNKIKQLNNIPEIYWIKSHIGICGNERADKIAKRAAFKALNQQQQQQHDNNNNNNNNNNEIITIADEASYLKSIQIEEQLLKQWNNEWINENRIQYHTHCKQIIPNIEFARDMFHHIYTRLKHNELKIIARLTSGHVNLRSYLYNINIINNPYCLHCNNNNKETIEHFIFECKYFKQQRKELYNNINKIIKKNNNKYQINLQLLLTGYPLDNWKQRKEIINHTISFVKDCNKMNI